MTCPWTRASPPNSTASWAAPSSAQAHPCRACSSLAGTLVGPRSCDSSTRSASLRRSSWTCPQWIPPLSATCARVTGSFCATSVTVAGRSTPKRPASKRVTRAMKTVSLSAPLVYLLLLHHPFYHQQHPNLTMKSKIETIFLFFFFKLNCLGFIFG